MSNIISRPANITVSTSWTGPGIRRQERTEPSVFLQEDEVLHYLDTEYEENME